MIHDTLRQPKSLLRAANESLDSAGSVVATDMPVDSNDDVAFRGRTLDWATMGKGETVSA